MVESVQVDALAVDLFKAIAQVRRVVHITGRVDGYRNRPVLYVDRHRRESDVRARVVLKAQERCVASLQRVAADPLEAIAGEKSATVARRSVERMGPDAISQDMP